LLVGMHQLHLAFPVTSNAIASANLSESEREILLYGLKEEPKKPNLFWWI
jgi:hypothetical protein